MAYALYANNGSEHSPPVNSTSAASKARSVSRQLLLNTWTHLAVTYDGASLKLYVNGAQVGSRPQSGSIPVTDGPLTLGGNRVWGEHFAGLIDEVRIYNRALSSAEIAADMTVELWSLRSRADAAGCARSRAAKRPRTTSPPIEPLQRRQAAGRLARA